MSRPRDTLTERATRIAPVTCVVLMANTTKRITVFENDRNRRQSGKRVEYFLDVLVLLELVDEGEHFRGLLLG
jgi:hypothetical protein